MKVTNFFVYVWKNTLEQFWTQLASGVNVVQYKLWLSLQ